MKAAFHLIDLVSQALAIEGWPAGWSDEQKISWLAERGCLAAVETHNAGAQIYRFRSAVGLEAIFFLNRGEFIFVADHTTFRPDNKGEVRSTDRRHH